MPLLHAALLLLLGASQVLAGVVAQGEKKRQVSTTKYCPSSTQICFSEFRTPTSNIIYRIAIPDDVAAAPFDILLQIVAPVSTTGWAGLAWGGSMTKNPLTIAWASGGGGAVVSSRWATGHTLPQPYTGATYTLLPTTTTNTTHLQLDVLCTGCSTWGTGTTSLTSLNPNGANTLAWAKGSRAPTTPGSNASSFAYHDDKGVFAHDLSVGKIPRGVFDAIAYDAGNAPPKPSSSSSTSVVVVPTATTSSRSGVVVPTTSTAVPTVVTSVVTLPPRPSTTTVKPPSTTTTVKPTSTSAPTTTTNTTIITKPTTSRTWTWTPDQPLTTKTSTIVVVPPKPTATTTAVVVPPWGVGPPFGTPPHGGRPPWRGPPWRRPPPGAEDEE
ncbi:hypothetical protein GE09DRAFT_1224175 [Coniochaeta sp. 2T2.1]|nr:hypothetical protein GE09DRAFT_1224175 [Coniochaeta sp. 2T2.1]